MKNISIESDTRLLTRQKMLFFFFFLFLSLLMEIYSQHWQCWERVRRKKYLHRRRRSGVESEKNYEAKHLHILSSSTFLLIDRCLHWWFIRTNSSSVSSIIYNSLNIHLSCIFCHASGGKIHEKNGISTDDKVSNILPQ